VEATLRFALIVSLSIAALSCTFFLLCRQVDRTPSLPGVRDDRVILFTSSPIESTSGFPTRIAKASFCFDLDQLPGRDPD
jgi:hypothetical protein